jgi:Tfp pilus assembly protein PilV
MRRLRSDAGFGLIEMLAALVMINVGILVILLTLNSGVLTLRRSAELATASVVADKQMEQYRAKTYASIYLDTTSVASADSTYTSDSAYCPTNCSDTKVTQTCSPLVSACTPTQALTGPDGRGYRVDTYIVWKTPAAGRPVKQVTVVVRKAGAAAALARVLSTFDQDF